MVRRDTQPAVLKISSTSLKVTTPQMNEWALNEREFVHLDFVICAISRPVAMENPLFHFSFELTPQFCNHSDGSLILRRNVAQTAHLNRYFDI